MIELEIPIAPVPKGRPRMTRAGHAYTPAKTREAEATIKEWLAFRLPRGWEPYTCAITVELVCYMKKPKTNKMEYPIGRPDLDNLVKTITDASNGLVWRDDSQIVELHAHKDWTDREARMFMRVYPTK